MKVDIDIQTDSRELEDIVDCIENIASIPRGSIPLSRGLGLNWENLSKVPDDLENDYAVDAAEQFGTYETRVSLSEVSFSYDQTSGETGVTLTFEEGEADE